MATKQISTKETIRRYRALYTGAVGGMLDKLGLRNQVLARRRRASGDGSWSRWISG
jgi:hypothetical protein